MRKKRKSAAVPVILLIVLILAAAGVGLYFAGKKAYESYIAAEHPIKYSEYVEKYADEYGLDKYVIYAFIKTESGFDPKAKSNIGARGLMQLMEVSFDWVKFRLGDGDEITYDDMFDPGSNIRYGTYLLHFLMDKYGDLDTAAAAYFSGVGEVDGWLGNSEYSKDGVHLDKIPSKNAAHYISKINDAYSTYLRLYAEERNG